MSYAAEVELLATVVERLPLGVIVFGKKRYDVVFVNNAAERLLHPTRVRRGQPLPDAWDTFSLRRYAERLIQPRVAVHPDERVEVDGGRVYIVSGLTADDTNSAVILIEDVSERDRRSRAEREFVANAAHELLTPLTGIVGAAHVLQAGAKDVPEDRDNFIEHIARECGRLTRIARSLLVLARAQSGEEPPRLEILNVRELIGEALDAAALDDGISLTVNCDESLTVLADADLFLQAAVNLIGNAGRHGSGDVVIEARGIGSSLVVIDLIDGTSGRTRHVDAMRGRFRTGEGRNSGGFGLGLSIASQSLGIMDGRLELDPSDSVVARIELPSGGMTEK
jgi:signal transduction histidine kinase